MTVVSARFCIVALLLTVPLLSCDKSQGISLWERHCEACHDGKTVINGKVLAGKEVIKEKYKTLESFASACTNSPACMNIVKHEERLLIKVGTELGIKKGN